MNDRVSNRHCVPLACCIALALAGSSFAAAAPRIPRAHGARVAALAATPPRAPHGDGVSIVSNCLDDGSIGSLRYEINHAQQNGTIDLTALECSTITLTAGAIAFQLDLTIHGPTDHVLTIAGNGADSIFVGGGVGTTAIDHLTMAHGRYDGAAGSTSVFGGCLYFVNNVVLDTVTVTDCSIGTADIPGYGAGLYALGATITSSTISGGTARAAGGVLVGGDVALTNSTISGNHASTVAGGLGTAGLLVMHNSTIAFNDATEGGAGVFLQGTPAPSIVSSIVADNIAPGGAAYAADISGNTLNPIAGDHDLIVASDLPVPSGTIAADPLLAPLADNGGRTATHALPAASPAIDAGSNPDTLPFDQRGEGYPRQHGAAPDIGAFELQSEVDGIFADGFDGGT